MKLVSRYIERDGTGRVALIPENPEDMWHAYNLISHGDTIRASTIRKVQTESATGSSSSSRVRTMLTVEVETIDFDTQACVLRLKGRNVEENPYVKMGAYHTVDIEPNRKFSLTKACWDIVALERIDMACDPSQNADVAAVIMHEGLANVCLVTGAMTLVRAKIDVTIPRKRKGSTSQHEKGLQKFYDTVLQAILRHVNFEVTRCILLASPGFVKDHFFEYMMQWASKNDNQVLADPAVTSRMADTKAMAEVKALENFYAVLQTEPSRAFYGLKHVLKANEGQAIDTLLVSDNLFRSQSVEERKTYVKLVESVRDNGGTTRIFSSLHVSGEQLIQLTGVAAILRFPMPELEEEPLDSDEDS
ncbi:Protein pelota [Daphnia magna]|uniref:Protein pelota homolog n=1 Tax=Daphnia magna TaxID=35525 RepID=A0A164QE13_9CRUS|nr:Protein pelota [Daphnia magna]